MKSRLGRIAASKRSRKGSHRSRWDGVPLRLCLKQGKVRRVRSLPRDRHQYLQRKVAHIRQSGQRVRLRRPMFMCGIIVVGMSVMVSCCRVKNSGGQTERGKQIQDAIAGTQTQSAIPVAPGRRPKTMKWKHHKTYTITFYRRLDIGVILTPISLS